MKRPPRLFWLLFLPLTAAVALSATAAIWFAEAHLERFAKEEESADLESAAHLALLGLADSIRSDPAALAAACLEMGQQSARRITLVLPSGAISCDTEAGHTKLDRPLELPEFKAAFAGGIGHAERFSSSRGRSYLYVAVPLRSAGRVTAVLRLGLPFKSVADRLALIRVQLLGAAAAIVLVGLAASYLIARLVARPIEELTVAVGRFAGGDLQAPLLAARTAESAALAEALAAMAGELRARIRAIELQRDRLERLELAGREFVRNVSHELKTPMATVMGYVELLLGGALEERRTATRFLENIGRQGERMRAIVDDLLVLTRLEQEGGEGGPGLERANVCDILAEAVRAVGPAAERASARIETACPEELTLPADPLLLSRAVANLLRNAVSHSAPGGTVRLEARRDAGAVAIRVRDEGPGIAPEHLPHIFERFYRVDRGRSRERGGSGLGLAIVREIVLAHGGDVSVESEPGRGSTFTISIPAGR